MFRLNSWRILALTAASIIISQRDARTAEPIVTTGIIDAPLAEVWRVWTTKEGWESCIVAHAEVDLRVGGVIRSAYSPDARIGDDSTIENTVLSFQPKKMLSFRVSKPPAKFPFKEQISQAWTVLMFEPVDDQHTRLTTTMLGFGDDELSLKMRGFFVHGNQLTLEKLQKKFAPPDDRAGDASASVDADRPLTILHKLAGGEWIYENTNPNGKVFRTRSVMEIGPDGSSLTARGWLGDAEGMYLHASTQAWREPATASGGATIRFQNLNDQGSVARGTIIAAGDNRVRWDWNETTVKGETHRFCVEMTILDADHYRFDLFDGSKSDDAKPLVSVVYQRVQQAPEAFTRMKLKR